MRSSLRTTVDSWKVGAQQLKAETYALYLAYKHPRTPWFAKAFAGVVVAYAFSPIDLIPDFIPILGYLDDLFLVPIGMTLALRMIPAAVMVECRTQAQINLRDGHPANWLAGLLIIMVWLILAVLCIIWMAKLLG